MGKRFIFLGFILLSIVSFAQIEISFDITDNADRINCYTLGRTTGKDVEVTYQITDAGTCSGNCIFYWSDGEDEGVTDADDIIAADASNVTFYYTSDGEFTPELVVIDNSNMDDTVKNSTIISIDEVSDNGSYIELIMTYETTNGQYIDTFALSYTEIDTATASTEAETIQVYSPVSSTFDFEVTESPNSEDYPDYPYPSESFLYTFTTDDDFVPFDDDIWVYYWDFGHDDPSGDADDKELGSYVLTTDTIDHLFPEENLDGYTVRLTIALDSSQFSDAAINTYDLSGCYDYTEATVVVLDEFFGTTAEEEDVDDRDPYVPNTFTPNGDNINEVFTFGTSGQDYYSLKVYNRWGNLVYEQGGLTISWDGKTNNGGLCSSGVYYYVISSDASDERHDTQGFIHLFRE